MTRPLLCAAAVALLAVLASLPAIATGQRAFTVVDDAAYAPPAPPPPPVLVWTAPAGSSLRATIANWADKAGWVEPRWDAEVDYPIVATMTFKGEFLDAVRDIFAAHSAVARPLQADVYVSQKFIHVTE